MAAECKWRAHAHRLLSCHGVPVDHLHDRQLSLDSIGLLQDDWAQSSSFESLQKLSIGSESRYLGALRPIHPPDQSGA